MRIRFAVSEREERAVSFFLAHVFPFSLALSLLLPFYAHTMTMKACRQGAGCGKENEQFTRFKKHVECRRRKSNKQRQKLLRLLPQSEVDLFRNAFLNNSCSMHFKLISYIFILEKIPLDQTLSITKNAVHFSVERQ